MLGPLLDRAVAVVSQAGASGARGLACLLHISVVVWSDHSESHLVWGLDRGGWTWISLSLDVQVARKGLSLDEECAGGGDWSVVTQ